VTRGLLAAGFVLAIAALSWPRTAAACSVSVTPLTFGPYDVFDLSPLDSVGQIRWSCPDGTPGIRISFGGNGRDRRLTNGTKTLRYGLFLDAARMRYWGDGAGGTEVFTGRVRAGGEESSVTVFGRIHPRQNVSPGAYSDTLTIVIDL
jgi:spore coat protein U-like protein